MCSRDPALWLKNIASSFGRVLIQDLSIAKRCANRECGIDTGDVARYSVSSHGLIGVTDPDLVLFDLSKSGYKIIDFERYDGTGCTNFVVLLNLRP
jgi:hypothetical protein